MDFVPIRGRKKKKGSSAAGNEGWRHGMHLVQSSSQDIGPQTAAAAVSRATTNGAVVGLQSKRDSRPSSSTSSSAASLRNALWPVSLSPEKKGKIDKILSKEDFLPNRGKKLLLRRINELLFNHRTLRDLEEQSPFYPKRGKKTRHFPKSTNSRPMDVMWFTKDDFYPHRGKKLDNNKMMGYLNVVAGVEDYNGEEENNLSSDGVIFGSSSSGGAGGRRDLDSMWRQNRELLSNLSKQEPRDKLRGRKRSVQADTSDHYDNAKLRSSVVALNEVIYRRYLYGR